MGWQRLGRGVRSGGKSGANFGAFSFFCFQFETNRKAATKHLCVRTELVQSPKIVKFIGELYFLRGQVQVQVFVGVFIRERARLEAENQSLAGIASRTALCIASFESDANFFCSARVYGNAMRAKRC